MKKSAILTAFLCLFSVLAYSMDTVNTKYLSETARQINSAYSRGDVLAMTDIESSLEKLLSSHGEQEYLVGYYYSLVNYRLGLVDYQNAKVHLQNCVEATKEISTAKPDFAEALVLKAACSNSLIGSLPEETMSLSLQARTSLEKAAQLEPKNPRLLFIQATAAVYTPEQFGGGLKAAEKLLTDSLNNFEVERENKKAELPSWGMDEAYMWSGMINSVQGKHQDAIAALERSLEIGKSEWVQSTLLPTLKKGESIGPYFGL